ncbi:MAG: RNA polymerase subunit sigma [Flavobacteriales bacterium]|nr:MAG: RNA polymerase subunit sigma [Flavobacteriales bacterium]
MRQLKITQSITNRAEASLDRYLTDVSKEKMVTAEEEVLLTKKIREGDQNALEKLVKANLRFVISVAKQYQNQGLVLMDLINEGNLGLIKAAQRFDETRGFKFISYAVWWIRQSIMQAVAEQSRIVRLPLNKVSDLGKIKRAKSTLEQKYEREPNAEELAELLEVPEYRVADSMKAGNFHVSMDAPFVNGEEYSLQDVLVNTDTPHTDNSLISESLHTEIDRALATLKDRESDVIRSFYGIGLKQSLSLEEIADKHNLTRERVRQIKERAIRNLRRGSVNKLLKSYL